MFGILISDLLDDGKGEQAESNYDEQKTHDDKDHCESRKPSEHRLHKCLRVHSCVSTRRPRDEGTHLAQDRSASEQEKEDRSEADMPQRLRF